MPRQTVDSGGPLNELLVLLPHKVAHKLGGRATATDWLPGGLWPEMDEVRAEQLRVRALLVDELRELRALAASFKKEDADNEAALKAAYRSGGARPSDDRTPPEEREAQRKVVEARLRAGAHVMVEAVERARAVMVAHETVWLGDLNHRAIAAQEAVREAQRLLEQAKATTWRSVRLGLWLKKEAQGGPFDRQPAPPEGEPLPAGVDPNELLANATSRLYYENDWVAPLPDVVVPIQRGAGAPVELIGQVDDDPLGTAVLDDGEKVDLIEPLDYETRYSRKAS